MQLTYAAHPPVQDVIDALGRTEDVRFSPSARRLAVAANSEIAVFRVDIAVSPGEKRISLTDAVILSSPHLKHPHGIDFFDEETIIVADRGGDACIFALPPAKANNGHACDAAPLGVIHAGEVELLNTPGSVSVMRKGPQRYGVLICNNFVHMVTKHRRMFGQR